MDAQLAPAILLIEDEWLIRISTAAMLEDAGFNVIEANDADEAIDLLPGHPEISVVITDVQMPGKIDGLGLVELVARDYPHVHTLVTSGRASVREAREHGARDFLAKPYSASAMETAVRGMLKS